MSVQRDVIPPVDIDKARVHAEHLTRSKRYAEAAWINKLADEVERLRFEIDYGPLEEVYPYIYATLPFRMEIGGHPVVVRRVSPGNCLLAQTDGGDVWYDLSDDGWVKREPL